RLPSTVTLPWVTDCCAVGGECETVADFGLVLPSAKALAPNTRQSSAAETTRSFLIFCGLRGKTELYNGLVPGTASDRSQNARRPRAGGAPIWIRIPAPTGWLETATITGLKTAGCRRVREGCDH